MKHFEHRMGRENNYNELQKYKRNSPNQEKEIKTPTEHEIVIIKFKREQK